MKRNLNLQFCALALIVASALFLHAGRASAQVPSIEGTYLLVSRTLKNGTIQRPPEVIGVQTYSKKYRQFNIRSKDRDGKMISRSIVAKYTLMPTEYVETPIFHVFTSNQEVRNLSEQPQRSAVTVDAGRITFQLEQRLTVFEKNGFTATSATNVDLWERVD
jgi:hypothetical protein